MFRLVAATALVFSLAMAANAQTPKFRKGQDYSQVQDALLALGWKGARPSGEKCEGHLCDFDKGEVISCAGTGLGQCLTRWTKANVVINVRTTGDQPALFEGLECLTQCQEDASAAPPGVSPPQANLDPLEAGLVRAMRLDAKRSERLGDTGEAIRAYIKAGYVRIKPELREDYTDYRVLRLPAKLFGQELVVIEEEYPSKYIGCCVSPGIGAIVRVTADLAPLKEFAASNGCSMDSDPEVIERLRRLKLKSIKGDHLSVSCRERDHVQR